MKNIVTWGLRISILTFFILHSFTSFFSFPILLYILSVSGILIFIFTFCTISLNKFKLPLFILISGIIILINSEAYSLNGVFEGIIQMRNVIGLLIVIPLISWVLQEEPYIEDLISVFHKLVNSSAKFYITLMSLTQVLTYFLLFGSMTMLYPFIDMFLKDQKSEGWNYYKSTVL